MKRFLFSSALFAQGASMTRAEAIQFYAAGGFPISAAGKAAIFRAAGFTQIPPFGLSLSKPRSS